MAKLLLKFSISIFLFFSILTFVPFSKPTLAQALPPLCGLGSATVVQGGALGIAYQGVTAGYQIFLWDGGSNRYDFGTTVDSTLAQQWISVTVPANAVPGTNYYGFIGTSTPMTCKTNSGGALTIAAGSGSGVGNPIGVINPPAGVMQVSGNPGTFVANLIRAIVGLLIIVAFIIDLFWIIFAGIRFVTAAGDSKTVASAWASIYWGILGMLIVMGSYAIVKLVEIFFNVCIITCFQFPTL